MCCSRVTEGQKKRGRVNDLDITFRSLSKVTEGVGSHCTCNVYSTKTNHDESLGCRGLTAALRSRILTVTYKNIISTGFRIKLTGSSVLHHHYRTEEHEYLQFSL